MNPYISRLLIVDQEARSATALLQTLAMRGFTVSGAHSALEALKLLRSERFDLLLTDLMLPQISGIELPSIQRCRPFEAGRTTTFSSPSTPA
jgi:two-component system, sensor histidine kinase ChiS